MNAIDHPPGSPVFEALKARIEALGYSVEGHCEAAQLSPAINGVVTLVRTNGPTLRCIPASPLDARHEATGKSHYESLVMLAESVGIELED